MFRLFKKKFTKSLSLVDILQWRNGIWSLIFFGFTFSDKNQAKVPAFKTIRFKEQYLQKDIVCYIPWNQIKGKFRDKIISHLTTWRVKWTSKCVGLFHACNKAIRERKYYAWFMKYTSLVKDNESSRDPFLRTFFYILNRANIFVFTG